MGQPAKVPVTMRALLQRINRELRAKGRVLKLARGERGRTEVGYYILDSQGMIRGMKIDPRKLGEELGVLDAWETVPKDENAP